MKSPSELYSTQGTRALSNFVRHELQGYRRTSKGTVFHNSYGYSRKTICISRNLAKIFSANSVKDIADGCANGISSFNVCVGSLSTTSASALQLKTSYFLR